MRTETIYLLTDDYPQRLDRLWNAVQRALENQSDEQASVTTTMLEGDPVSALSAEYEALKAEAEDASRAAARRVVLRPLTRSEWRPLKEKHPPRKDDEGDRLAGVNADAIEDDLVYTALVEPEFKSRSAFDEWAEELSPGEWSAVTIKAWELTNGVRYDPKSLPASPNLSTA